jgi:NAD(P)-dependent dehydrogenase (short-subunit alcohol dehydrogenase family)
VGEGDGQADPDLGRGAVVVTGASTGIGRATAVELDRIGFRVFAGVRKETDADSIRAEGSDRLEPLMVDVTDAASIEAAERTVGETIGDSGLAGLVNNAGVAVPGPVELLALDDLRRQLEINLVGQVAVTQAFLPALRLGHGKLVFMSSVGGRISLPFNAAYHMSKWGVEALGDALRLELAPWGIDVVLIEPGSIATPIWEKGAAEGDALEDSADDTARELYAERLEKFRNAAMETGAEGIPPERVADVVAEALTADRPKTRYLVGSDAKRNARVRRVVPDRLFDRLISRELGLG